MTTPSLTELEALFRQQGFADFAWIDPKRIVVAQWVRLKCMFGCSEYGRTATCPPITPSVPECERFFREYETAVLFHFAKAVAQPEERFQWTQSVSRELLKLERAVFLAGYRKAFLLFMDSCPLCPECVPTRAQCRDPFAARPTPEALAVDVFATVKQYGFPIEVLQDYTQKMNRYAILMVD